ncbi:MAG: hypothetical protein CL936_16190 [Deltaproteobacteria bacterium]|nr:hypothetical protein [Deltaproteobacteria bacterium]
MQALLEYAQSTLPHLQGACPNFEAIFVVLVPREPHNRTWQDFNADTFVDYTASRISFSHMRYDDVRRALALYGVIPGSVMSAAVVASGVSRDTCISWLKEFPDFADLDRVRHRIELEVADFTDEHHEVYTRLDYPRAAELSADTLTHNAHAIAYAVLLEKALEDLKDVLRAASSIYAWPRERHPLSRIAIVYAQEVEVGIMHTGLGQTSKIWRADKLDDQLMHADTAFQFAQAFVSVIGGMGKPYGHDLTTGIRHGMIDPYYKRDYESIRCTLKKLYVTGVGEHTLCQMATYVSSLLLSVTSRTQRILEAYNEGMMEFITQHALPAVLAPGRADAGLMHEPVYVTQRLLGSDTPLMRCGRVTFAGHVLPSRHPLCAIKTVIATLECCDLPLAPEVSRRLDEVSRNYLTVTRANVHVARDQSAVDGRTLASLGVLKRVLIAVIDLHIRTWCVPNEIHEEVRTPRPYARSSASRPTDSMKNGPDDSRIWCVLIRTSRHGCAALRLRHRRQLMPIGDLQFGCLIRSLQLCRVHSSRLLDHPLGLGGCELSETRWLEDECSVSRIYNVQALLPTRSRYDVGVDASEAAASLTISSAEATDKTPYVVKSGSTRYADLLRETSQRLELPSRPLLLVVRDNASTILEIFGPFLEKHFQASDLLISQLCECRGEYRSLTRHRRKLHGNLIHGNRAGVTILSLDGRRAIQGQIRTTDIELYRLRHLVESQTLLVNQSMTRALSIGNFLEALSLTPSLNFKNFLIKPQIFEQRLASIAIAEHKATTMLHQSRADAVRSIPYPWVGTDVLASDNNCAIKVLLAYHKGVRWPMLSTAHERLDDEARCLYDVTSKDPTLTGDDPVLADQLDEVARELRLTPCYIDLCRNLVCFTNPLKRDEASVLPDCVVIIAEPGHCIAMRSDTEQHFRLLSQMESSRFVCWAERLQHVTLGEICQGGLGTSRSKRYVSESHDFLGRSTFIEETRLLQEDLTRHFERGVAIETVTRLRPDSDYLQRLARIKGEEHVCRILRGLGCEGQFAHRFNREYGPSARRAHGEVRFRDPIYEPLQDMLRGHKRMEIQESPRSSMRGGVRPVAGALTEWVPGHLHDPSLYELAKYIFDRLQASQDSRTELINHWNAGHGPYCLTLSAWVALANGQLGPLRVLCGEVHASDIELNIANGEVQSYHAVAENLWLSPIITRRVLDGLTLAIQSWHDQEYSAAFDRFCKISDALQDQDRAPFHQLPPSGFHVLTHVLGVLMVQEDDKACSSYNTKPPWHAGLKRCTVRAALLRLGCLDHRAIYNAYENLQPSTDGTDHRDYRYLEKQLSASEVNKILTDADSHQARNGPAFWPVNSLQGQSVAGVFMPFTSGSGPRTPVAQLPELSCEHVVMTCTLIVRINLLIDHLDDCVIEMGSVKHWPTSPHHYLSKIADVFRDEFSTGAVENNEDAVTEILNHTDALRGTLGSLVSLIGCMSGHQSYDHTLRVQSWVRQSNASNDAMDWSRLDGVDKVGHYLYTIGQVWRNSQDSLKAHFGVLWGVQHALSDAIGTYHGTRTIICILAQQLQLLTTYSSRVDRAARVYNNAMSRFIFGPLMTICAGRGNYDPAYDSFTPRPRIHVTKLLSKYVADDLQPYFGCCVPKLVLSYAYRCEIPMLDSVNDRLDNEAKRLMMLFRGAPEGEFCCAFHIEFLASITQLRLMVADLEAGIYGVTRDQLGVASSACQWGIILRAGSRPTYCHHGVPVSFLHRSATVPFSTTEIHRFICEHELVSRDLDHVCGELGFGGIIEDQMAKKNLLPFTQRIVLRATECLTACYPGVKLCNDRSLVRKMDSPYVDAEDWNRQSSWRLQLGDNQEEYDPDAWSREIMGSERLSCCQLLGDQPRTWCVGPLGHQGPCSHDHAAFVPEITFDLEMRVACERALTHENQKLQCYGVTFRGKPAMEKFVAGILRRMISDRLYCTVWEYQWMLKIAQHKFEALELGETVDEVWRGPSLYQYQPGGVALDRINWGILSSGRHVRLGQRDLAEELSGNDPLRIRRRKVAQLCRRIGRCDILRVRDRVQAHGARCYLCGCEIDPSLHTFDVDHAEPGFLCALASAIIYISDGPDVVTDDPSLFIHGDFIQFEDGFFSDWTANALVAYLHTNFTVCVPVHPECHVSHTREQNIQQAMYGQPVRRWISNLIDHVHGPDATLSSKAILAAYSEYQNYTRREESLGGPPLRLTGAGPEDATIPRWPVTLIDTTSEHELLSITVDSVTAAVRKLLSQSAPMRTLQSAQPRIALTVNPCLAKCVTSTHVTTFGISSSAVIPTSYAFSQYQRRIRREWKCTLDVLRAPPDSYWQWREYYGYALILALKGLAMSSVICAFLDSLEELAIWFDLLSMDHRWYFEITDAMQETTLPSICNIIIKDYGSRFHPNIVLLNRLHDALSTLAECWYCKILDADFLFCCHQEEWRWCEEILMMVIIQALCDIKDPMRSLEDPWYRGGAGMLVLSENGTYCSFERMLQGDIRPPVTFISRYPRLARVLMTVIPFPSQSTHSDASSVYTQEAVLDEFRANHYISLADATGGFYLSLGSSCLEHRLHKQIGRQLKLAILSRVLWRGIIVHSFQAYLLELHSMRPGGQAYLVSEASFYTHAALMHKPSTSSLRLNGAGLHFSDGSENDGAVKQSATLRQTGLAGGAYGDDIHALWNNVRVRVMQRLTSNVLNIRTGLAEGRDTVQANAFFIRFDDRPFHVVKVDLNPSLRQSEDGFLWLLGHWQTIGNPRLAPDPEDPNDVHVWTRGVCPHCWFPSDEVNCPSCGRSPSRQLRSQTGPSRNPDGSSSLSMSLMNLRYCTLEIQSLVADGTVEPHSCLWSLPTTHQITRLVNPMQREHLRGGGPPELRVNCMTSLKLGQQEFGMMNICVKLRHRVMPLATQLLHKVAREVAQLEKFFSSLFIASLCRHCCISLSLSRSPSYLRLLGGGDIDHDDLHDNGSFDNAEMQCLFAIGKSNSSYEAERNAQFIASIQGTTDCLGLGGLRIAAAVKDLLRHQALGHVLTCHQHLMDLGLVEGSTGQVAASHTTGSVGSYLGINRGPTYVHFARYVIPFRTNSSKHLPIMPSEGQTLSAPLDLQSGLCLFGDPSTLTALPPGLYIPVPIFDICFQHMSPNKGHLIQRLPCLLSTSLDKLEDWSDVVIDNLTTREVSDQDVLERYIRGDTSDILYYYSIPLDVSESENENVMNALARLEQSMDDMETQRTYMRDGTQSSIDIDYEKRDLFVLIEYMIRAGRANHVTSVSTRPRIIPTILEAAFVGLVNGPYSMRFWHDCGSMMGIHCMSGTAKVFSLDGFTSCEIVARLGLAGARHWQWISDSLHQRHLLQGRDWFQDDVTQVLTQMEIELVRLDVHQAMLAFASMTMTEPIDFCSEVGVRWQLLTPLEQRHAYATIVEAARLEILRDRLKGHIQSIGMIYAWTRSESTSVIVHCHPLTIIARTFALEMQMPILTSTTSRADAEKRLIPLMNHVDTVVAMAQAHSTLVGALDVSNDQSAKALTPVTTPTATRNRQLPFGNLMSRLRYTGDGERELFDLGSYVLTLLLPLIDRVGRMADVYNECMGRYIKSQLLSSLLAGHSGSELADPSLPAVKRSDEVYHSELASSEWTVCTLRSSHPYHAVKLLIAASQRVELPISEQCSFELDEQVYCCLQILLLQDRQALTVSRTAMLAQLHSTLLAILDFRSGVWCTPSEILFPAIIPRPPSLHAGDHRDTDPSQWCVLVRVAEDEYCLLRRRTCNRLGFMGGAQVAGIIDRYSLCQMTARDMLPSGLKFVRRQATSSLRLNGAGPPSTTSQAVLHLIGGGDETPEPEGSLPLIIPRLVFPFIGDGLTVLSRLGQLGTNFEEAFNSEPGSSVLNTLVAHEPPRNAIEEVRERSEAHSWIAIYVAELSVSQASSTLEVAHKRPSGADYTAILVRGDAEGLPCFLIRHDWDVDDVLDAGSRIASFIIDQLPSHSPGDVHELQQEHLSRALHEVLQALEETTWAIRCVPCVPILIMSHTCAAFAPCETLLIQNVVNSSTLDIEYNLEGTGIFRESEIFSTIAWHAREYLWHISYSLAEDGCKYITSYDQVYAIGYGIPFHGPIVFEPPAYVPKEKPKWLQQTTNRAPPWSAFGGNVQRLRPRSPHHAWECALLYASGSKRSCLTYVEAEASQRLLQTLMTVAVAGGHFSFLAGALLMLEDTRIRTDRRWVKSDTTALFQTVRGIMIAMLEKLEVCTRRPVLPSTETDPSNPGPTHRIDRRLTDKCLTLTWSLPPSWKSPPEFPFQQGTDDTIQVWVSKRTRPPSITGNSITHAYVQGEIAMMRNPPESTLASVREDLSQVARLTDITTASHLCSAVLVLIASRWPEGMPIDKQSTVAACHQDYVSWLGSLGDVSKSTVTTPPRYGKRSSAVHTVPRLSANHAPNQYRVAMDMSTDDEREFIRALLGEPVTAYEDIPLPLWISLLSLISTVSYAMLPGTRALDFMNEFIGGHCAFQSDHAKSHLDDASSSEQDGNSVMGEPTSRFAPDPSDTETRTVGSPNRKVVAEEVNEHIGNLRSRLEAELQANIIKGQSQNETNIGQLRSDVVSLKDEMRRYSLSMSAAQQKHEASAKAMATSQSTESLRRELENKEKERDTARAIKLKQQEEAESKARAASVADRATIASLTSMVKASEERDRARQEQMADLASKVSKVTTPDSASSENDVLRAQIETLSAKLTELTDAKRDKELLGSISGRTRRIKHPGESGDTSSRQNAPSSALLYQQRLRPQLGAGKSVEDPSGGKDPGRSDDDYSHTKPRNLFKRHGEPDDESEGIHVVFTTAVRECQVAHEAHPRAFLPLSPAGSALCPALFKENAYFPFAYVSDAAAACVGCHDFIDSNHPQHSELGEVLITEFQEALTNAWIENGNTDNEHFTRLLDKCTVTSTDTPQDIKLSGVSVPVRSVSIILLTLPNQQVGSVAIESELIVHFVTSGKHARNDMVLPSFIGTPQRAFNWDSTQRHISLGTTSSSLIQFLTAVFDAYFSANTSGAPITSSRMLDGRLREARMLPTTVKDAEAQIKLRDTVIAKCNVRIKLGSDKPGKILGWLESRQPLLRKLVEMAADIAILELSLISNVYPHLLNQRPPPSTQLDSEMWRSHPRDASHIAEILMTLITADGADAAMARALAGPTKEEAVRMIAFLYDTYSARASGHADSVAEKIAHVIRLALHMWTDEYMKLHGIPELSNKYDNILYYDVSPLRQPDASTFNSPISFLKSCVYVLQNVHELYQGTEWRLVQEEIALSSYAQRVIVELRDNFVATSATLAHIVHMHLVDTQHQKRGHSKTSGRDYDTMVHQMTLRANRYSGVTDTLVKQALAGFQEAPEVISFLKGLIEGIHFSKKDNAASAGTASKPATSATPRPQRSTRTAQFALGCVDNSDDENQERQEVEVETSHDILNVDTPTLKSLTQLINELRVNMTNLVSGQKQLANRQQTMESSLFINSPELHKQAASTAKTQGSTYALTPSDPVDASGAHAASLAEMKQQLTNLTALMAQKSATTPSTSDSPESPQLVALKQEVSTMRAELLAMAERPPAPTPSQGNASAFRGWANQRQASGPSTGRNRNMNGPLQAKFPPTPVESHCPECAEILQKMKIVSIDDPRYLKVHPKGCMFCGSLTHGGAFCGAAYMLSKKAPAGRYSELQLQSARERIAKSPMLFSDIAHLVADDEDAMCMLAMMIISDTVAGTGLCSTDDSGLYTCYDSYVPADKALRHQGEPAQLQLLLTPQ